MRCFRPLRKEGVFLSCKWEFFLKIFLRIELVPTHIMYNCYALRTRIIFPGIINKAIHAKMVNHHIHAKKTDTKNRISKMTAHTVFAPLGLMHRKIILQTALITARTLTIL